MWKCCSIILHWSHHRCFRLTVDYRFKGISLRRYMSCLRLRKWLDRSRFWSTCKSSSNASVGILTTIIDYMKQVNVTRSTVTTSSELWPTFSAVFRARSISSTLTWCCWELFMVTVYTTLWVWAVTCWALYLGLSSICNQSSLLNCWIRLSSRNSNVGKGGRRRREKREDSNGSKKQLWWEVK